jgi:alpha-tubulin suppressor-like RCC1 family protein
MKLFEGMHVKDITCSYKYVAILNDKGEIYVWGSYLRDKLAKKAKEQESKKN